NSYNSVFKTMAPHGEWSASPRKHRKNQRLGERRREREQAEGRFPPPRRMVVAPQNARVNIRDRLGPLLNHNNNLNETREWVAGLNSTSAMVSSDHNVEVHHVETEVDESNGLVGESSALVRESSVLVGNEG